MGRLFNLDYLRGLAAFGIMMFHYLSWTVGEFTVDTFMGRLGIYGVSLFYILSGLTLHYVYYDKMTISKDGILSFFKKRIFRIFPLLWLITIIAVIGYRKWPDFTDLFLNLTGLFGFVRWDKYFSAGVWSIGNELVFYVFFPLFILLIKKNKPLMVLLSTIIMGLYLYFAFVKLNPELLLKHQWKNYVNPLNQLFLFLGGFLIGHFLHNIKIKNIYLIILLLISLLLFALYPVTGDMINIVTGMNRLFFTVCCFLVCICFYKISYRFPDFIHKPLTLLGEASYSVYLLHPLVYKFTSGVFGIFSTYVFNISTAVLMPLAIVETLILSYFVYQYFEKYFMKVGNRKVNNLV